MVNEMGEKGWNQGLLSEVKKWLEAAYPAEGCGLILEDQQGEWSFQRCENVIDKYHAVDPEMYPRTSTEFYMIDPREFMKAEDRGERVAVIVHSHPDVGDYFSEADESAALMPRDDESEPLEPIYPGTDYLVVSVRSGAADGASLFRFDEEERCFQRAYRLSEEDLRGAFSSRTERAETVA